MRDPARPAVVALSLLALSLAASEPALARSRAAHDVALSPEAPLDEPALPPPASLPSDYDDSALLDDLPSIPATELGVWIVSSGDNKGLPYLIVDKPSAQVLVYDGAGVLEGSAPALLGIAQGDDTAPGIGHMELSNIPMNERTTPAGRFVASLGPADGMDEVLWVDVDSALSLHAVITSNPKEHRLQRLSSPSPEQRRISHGCINVPTRFYKDVIDKTFAGTKGIVYIVPDTKPLEQVFPALASAGF